MWLVASRPGLFTSKERAPGTYRIRGLVGPRAVLDVIVVMLNNYMRNSSELRAVTSQSV
jgi:hypothetical protein